MLEKLTLVYCKLPENDVLTDPNTLLMRLYIDFIVLMLMTRSSIAARACTRISSTRRRTIAGEELLWSAICPHPNYRPTREKQKNFSHRQLLAC